MAESDAAGHGPRPKRRATISDLAREFDRSAAPIRAMLEQTERQFAPMRAAVERAAAFRREILGEENEGEPPPKPKPPAPPPQSAAPPQRPPFEEDPPQGLLVALRQAFPGFKPTDQWWVHVERELKNAHHRSNPEAHDAFVSAYWKWTADDLTRHLEAEGRVKRARIPRGATVCERLRALHKEDPDFAETAPEQKVALRIGKKSAGSLSKSTYWRFTLKPRRAEVRARAQLARAGRRTNAATPSKAQARSENWDQREAVRRLDAEIDGGH